MKLTAHEHFMILDHRAVTLSHLGNHKSALQDGRCMIKVQKRKCQVEYFFGLKILVYRRRADWDRAICAQA